MRYTFLLLFCYLTAFSQNEKKYTIEGQYYNCKTQDPSSFGTFLRLKLGSSSIKDSIKPVHGDFKITGVAAGNYTLEYCNDFEQLISKPIEIKENISNIQLCTEEFIDTKEKTIIENIKEKDTFKLDVTSAGCFHFEKYSIKLFYKQNKLISEYYINKKRKKKITLDAKTLKELIVFERMVLQRNRRRSFSICTSSMNYSFQLNGKKEIEIHDGSCDWDGYYVMVKKIFNVN